MQFTPNVRERYAAEFRNLITRRLLNGKDIEKNLELLKIISVFSALCRQETKEEVKVLKSVENLLKEASLKYANKEKQLYFSLEGKENYEIDYSLLKLLILELISSPIKSKVFLKGMFLKNRIIFNVQNAKLTQVAKCFIKKLNGVLIKERGESNLSVMLSTPSVSYNKSLKEDNEDFKNPFSTINVML